MLTSPIVVRSTNECGGQRGAFSAFICFNNRMKFPYEKMSERDLKLEGTPAEMLIIIERLSEDAKI